MTLPNFAAVAQFRAEQLVAVGIEPGRTGAKPVRGVAALVGEAPFAERLAAAKATGQPGELTVIRLATATEPEVLGVGVGDRSASHLVQAAAAVARRAGNPNRIALALAPKATAGGVRGIVEGFALASYSPKPTVGGEARQVGILTAESEAVAKAVSTARAVYLARDLVAAPANLKSPQWLAEQAELVAKSAALSTKTWTEVDLRTQGFGGLIGVGQGSSRPPRFVELGYLPAGLSARAASQVPHIVLIGKGITFDSGGISIKPAAGMELMKTDMAGAAAVLGTMSALSKLGIRVRVTGLLAIAENLPGAAALRPGDVIIPYGGRRTVEVLNTDAEGRLVLADALGYADLVLKPDAMVDLATLTGAATLALGRRDAPLYATDERLAAGLERAAALAGERVWRMPLVEEYRSALNSDTADLANSVNDRAVGAGSITAALFLREFTGGRPWAHLDIAGTGRSDRPVDELCKGGTGFGVRLLLRWLAGL